MKTKYDTNDKVWIMATIRKAEKVKDRIYYTIDESEYVVPEELCKECTDEEISALAESRRVYQCATVENEVGYSTCHSRILP